MAGTALQPALQSSVPSALSGADLELTSGATGRNPSELGVPEFSSAGDTATDVMLPGGISMPNDGRYEFHEETAAAPVDQTDYIDSSHLYGVTVDDSHDGSPLQEAATGNPDSGYGRLRPDPSHADDKGASAAARWAPEPDIGQPHNYLVTTPSNDNTNTYTPNGELVTVPGERTGLDVAHFSNDGMWSATPPYTGYSERPLYVTTAEMPAQLQSGGDRIGDNSQPGNSYADGGFGAQAIPLVLPSPPDPATVPYAGGGSGPVMDLGYGGAY